MAFRLRCATCSLLLQIQLVATATGTQRELGSHPREPSPHPSTAEISLPLVSRPAPDWEATAVIEGEFKRLRLSDYRGRYLVLLFYPLDFSFVCPTEVISFSERVQEFRDTGAEVVACSTDSQYSHLAWINTPRRQGGLGPMRIPLLSDLTHQIAKDYGVYMEDAGHSLRGLFIIDGRGVVRQVTLNDLPVGRSVEETLRLVQALQHTDKHGTVCPAGWKPGEDTIIPDHFIKMELPNRTYHTRRPTAIPPTVIITLNSDSTT